jgi:hypothetical protein
LIFGNQVVYSSDTRAYQQNLSSQVFIINSPGDRCAGFLGIKQAMLPVCLRCSTTVLLRTGLVRMVMLAVAAQRFRGASIVASSQASSSYGMVNDKK